MEEAEAVRKKLTLSTSQKWFQLFTQMGLKNQKSEGALACTNQTGTSVLQFYNSEQEV